MSRRRIWAIARKDVLAARRDSRILVLLVLPLVLALLIRTGESTGAPEVHIAVAGPAPPELVTALRTQAGREANVTVTSTEAREVVKRVRDGDDDAGIVVGTGFLTDLKAGRHPPLKLILPRSRSSSSAVAVGLVDPALRLLAGQQPPARVAVETVDAGDDGVADELGADRYTLLVIVVYLIANIALIVVPTLVAEEEEQGTIEALLLAGSPADVAAAKALVGLAAIAITLVLTLVLGDITPADTVLFGAGALMLSVALIGFGLWLGVLLREPTRVNTWMGVLIVPVIAPAVAIGFSLPAVASVAVSLTPPAEGARLLANGLAGETVFEHPLLSVLGLLVWSAIAYALLVRALARREA